MSDVFDGVSLQVMFMMVHIVLAVDAVKSAPKNQVSMSFYCICEMSLIDL